MRTSSAVVASIVGLLGFCSAAHAVNDGLWMSLRYSVSVVYVGILEKGVDMPQPKSVEMADYPIEAWRAAVSGEAMLIVAIAPDGSVGDVVVEKATLPVFGVAAAQAAAKWRFYPGVLLKERAKAVSTHLRCRIQFRADES